MLHLKSLSLKQFATTKTDSKISVVSRLSQRGKGIKKIARTFFSFILLTEKQYRENGFSKLCLGEKILKNGLYCLRKKD